MLSRTTLAALLLCAIVPPPLPAADQRADDAPVTSITIYSDAVHSATEARGRALVQQRRRVELPRGEGRIDITGIPTMLDPASVLLRAAGDDAPFAIVEQHLHDVATDPDAVLRQYVGQEILINRRPSGPGDQQARLTETINAKLLAFDEKVLVLQTNNRQLPVQIIARGPEITEIKLTRAGNMPAMRPTLSWQVSTDKSGARDVDLIYETRGLAWDANYTLLLDGDGPAASLEAWANVVNRSGAPFADAELRLVLEGGPDREQRPVPGVRYSIPRRVTLPPDGARRLALLDGGKRVNLARLNVLAPSRAGDVMECLSLPNTRKNHLGFALPPGRVRVLRKGDDDDDGAPVTLLAHSRVSPTAPDVPMIVPLARADGFVATRAVANSPETIDGGQRVARVTTVTIANHRKQNAQVLLIEDLDDRAARVIRHSHPYDERAGAGAGAGAGDAGSIAFLLDVSAGEAQTVSFAVAVE